MYKAVSSPVVGAQTRERPVMVLPDVWALLTFLASRKRPDLGVVLKSTVRGSHALSWGLLAWPGFQRVSTFRTAQYHSGS